ncbi:hypothetical protein ACH5RR_005648 [Cinchona calisaya]|uniref:TF-B3 domain-containing protein n=1 Tax=Cinchona calisaya TaxID=153742 RepID=A0ABD3ALQ4_9GENT
MSINHYSSPDLPEAVWWAQPHPHMETPSSSSKSINTTPSPTTFWATNSQLYHPSGAATKPMFCAAQTSTLNFDLNNEDDEEIIIDDERENKAAEQQQQQQEDREFTPKDPLFEKPLTPSDVGKLNRLVIPKQHAEKYFPLGGGNDSGEKGLLLSFEDESGKPWRFRYSYWNSSQSYVLTKGWSRFVKEKKLDAGDIVLFERHRLDSDRLFIGWRRRRSAAAAASGQESTIGVAQPATAGGGGWTRVYFPPGHPYPGGQQQQQAHHHGPAIPYQPHCLHAAAAGSVMQNPTSTAATSSANSKRLRLFGVNLECQQQPDDDEYSDPPEDSSTWSHGQGQTQPNSQFQYYPKPYFNHHNHHMDINFSRDVNRTRYHQG